MFLILVQFIILFCCCELYPYRFVPLNLGDIMPSGWLKDQINIQGMGMSGFIDEFWSDIQYSEWIGGWSEGWERFPYYMDGFYALAVLSQDKKLLQKANDHINYILNNQQSDGWLGPITGRGNLGKGFNPKYDPWPSFVMLKTLIQVHSFTQNETILDACIKCAMKIDSIITDKGLDPFVWAKYRLPDFVYVLEYLYDNIPSKQLDNMLQKYSFAGFDWFKHFSDFSKFENKQTRPVPDTLAVHGVNNAQAIKFPAVRFRVDKNPSTLNLMKDWILNKLQKYHGTATGLFHGDELYGGLSPTQGSELCLIVETMFSLEVSGLVSGEPWIFDLLEKIAYNNLPSALNQYMKEHQYVTLDNQVICKRGTKTNFTDVGIYGPLYGVSPNYGCCTANFHQGWPKFIENLWAADLQKNLMDIPALVMLVHAPSVVTTTIISAPATKPIPVQLQVTTDYPFGDGNGTITVLSNTYPLEYGICYRIPEWDKEQYVKTNGTGFLCERGKWKKGDVVKYAINLDVYLSDYTYHESVSLFRGPLLLSKSISHEDSRVFGCKLPIQKNECEDYYDYEKYPSEDWNYGIFMDRKNPKKSVLDIEINKVPKVPFGRNFTAASGEDYPVKVSVMGATINEWKIDEEFQIAGEVPHSPVTKYGDVKTIELIPVGSTDLRVSVFPTLN